MREQAMQRRRGPFLIATAVGATITLAIFRLPELFVDQLRRNRFLTSTQAGWAFRLLLIVAVVQATYVSLALLRPERIERARENDAKLKSLPLLDVAGSLARNAATMAILPLAYGLAAFILTGERAGFWAFVTVTVAQILWSYRQTGAIVRFFARQPPS